MRAPIAPTSSVPPRHRLQLNRRRARVIDADSGGDGNGDVEILSSDDENLDEYVKGPDELVMLRRVNVSDQMEVLLLGSLGANVPVRDDDSRPARDKAKETFARKAAHKALDRQEKERRSKSRRLN